MQEEAQTFEYKPENKNVAIVLLGNFNPLMFQPNWFSVNGIISQLEADASITNNNPCIIAPNITIFNTPQLQIQVQENRFSVTAIKESFSTLKDVVKKSFERLGAMPITAMGINTSAHFNILDKTKFHKFGDRLSPKQYWEKLLGNNTSGDDRTGGLVKLQMMNPKEDKTGIFSVIIERSVRFKYGIFINCNDHYQFENNTDAEIAMQRLEESFDISIQKSIDIQVNLFKDL